MTLKPLEIRRVTRYPIWHAYYADQRTLALAFVRMQEFYESPRFCGRVFTLEEFSTWYSQACGHGEFTYPEDWSGFNVPSTAVRAVRDRFRGHHQEEKFLLAALKTAGVFRGRRFTNCATACSSAVATIAVGSRPRSNAPATAACAVA